MTKSFRQELRGCLLFVGAIWAVFLINFILPWDLNNLGLVPRSIRGVFGIPLAPFLHANFQHLIGNTVPLVILLMLLISSRSDARRVVILNILLGGALLWVFGRPAIHIGASGLIYGLSLFLIVIGFRERQLGSIAVAVIVAVVYGGTLVSGIVPGLHAQESWDGHLCGGIAGALIASRTTVSGVRRIA